MTGTLYFAVALFCLVIAAVILWVNSRRVINQALVLCLVLASLSFYSVHMAFLAAVGANPSARTPAEVLFWLRLNAVATAFVPWAMWLMKSAIVFERTSLCALVNRSWLWLGGSCLLAAVCFTDLFIPPESTPGNPLTGIGYVVFVLGLLALSVLILLSSYRVMRQTTGIRRMEIQFLLFNGCAVFLLTIVTNSLRRYLHAPTLVYAGPLLIITMLSILVWALTYHRILDARHVVLSLGQRITMLVILACSVLGLTNLLSSALGASVGLVLGAILAGIFVGYLNQLSLGWLKLDQEQQLAGPRAEIIGLTRTESDQNVLREKLEFFLRNLCQTNLAEILFAHENTFVGRRLAIANQGFVRACREGWMTPEHLQRLRHDPTVDESLELMNSQGLAAVIAVPRGSDSPSLLVALGPKHSLRPYTYPDITLLLSLAELMDNILSHARLTADAAKISRMESAAMMSRGLAHDLNNLTTPVSSYLLHREGRDSTGSVEAEVYAAARHSIKVMQEYIRESLFFARRLVPEFKEVNSDDILASAAQLALERAARRGVQLNIRRGETFRFTADPVLVQRLVLNLVNNAIDASKPGALVEVSVAGKNQGKIGIMVTDQGAGISRENHGRIFDPYFTTKDTGDEVRGIGLGLSICRKIADLHHGEIEMSSAPGQGSTFTAVFPRNPVQRPPDNAAPDYSIATEAWIDSKEGMPIETVSSHRPLV